MNIGYLIYLTKNSILSRVRYRASNIVSIINVILSLVIQIAIWNALFAGNKSVLAGDQSISIYNMVQYVVFSMIISFLLSNNIMSDISGRIQTGQIAIDVIRPVGLFMQIIGGQLSNIISSFLFSFIPLVIFSTLIYGLKILMIQNIFYFFLVLINSAILYYMINYMLGLLSFWFINISPLTYVLEGFINLLSGVLIPIWFIKNDIILKMIEILPFRLIYFFPISIGLNATPHQDILPMIVQQYIWIFVFVIITYVLWKKGIKKITVQGG